MTGYSPLTVPMATPVYPEVSLYSTLLGAPRPWEFNGWMQESMSWKNGCYIHAGLSGPSETTFEGPDAAEFLSGLCINGFSGFEPGSEKHAVMLNDDGLIAMHALLQRAGEQKFKLFAGGPWPGYHLSKSDADVQMSLQMRYIFQVSGPTALQVLEKVTGEDLRDIKFLRVRSTKVAGLESEISRIGMSGTLAYELRGPLEEGPQVYDAVYQAGQEFGIERLGWRTYTVNHVEGGFPQGGWTFEDGMLADEGFLEYIQQIPELAPLFVGRKMGGSVDPADLRLRLRTPVEVDWHRAARFDHDFIGREALEQEMADPKRTIVTLRWNADDVTDIHASLLKPGEHYKLLDYPGMGPMQGHADYVLSDGELVGVSSGTTYSYYYREVISHCTIDIDQAQIGNEVIVQWGDFGGRIKDVRATVERYPYLDLERNQSYDVSKAG